MTGLEGDLTLALQYGTIGLAWGCYIGHKVTNWLWKQRLEQLKLDWTEELFERKPTTGIGWQELCVCGHTALDHSPSGPCSAAHQTEDSGLCSCVHFNRKNT